MSHGTKVSFAKVPGAGSESPVEQEKPKDANAALVGDTPPAANSQLATQAPQPPATRFLGGDEEDGDTDRSDVRLPRLNIIQGLSGADLKSIKRPDGTNAPDGSLVLKKALFIPQPARIVVAGFSRKQYSEKMPKFGEGKPRLLDTLEEVHAAGGTDQWRQSRENKDKDGMPVSRRPWFVPMVTGLLLIQKWDGIRPEDEEHFTAVSEDGIAFAPAVFTVKSTGFEGFYVPLKSEQAAGVLKNGFYTRYVVLSTRQDKAFTPVVSIGEHTSEAVRALAKSIRA